jgi:small subunit ribosomal protein S9
MAKSGTDGFYATGRRKEATARVWVKAGTGSVIINGRPMNEYFGRETSIMVINQPLQVLEQLGKIDMTVNVRGGGLSGQAGAIRHGLSRALCAHEPRSPQPAEEGRLPHPRCSRGRA